MDKWIINLGNTNRINCISGLAMGLSPDQSTFFSSFTVNVSTEQLTAIMRLNVIVVCFLKIYF